MLCFRVGSACKIRGQFFASVLWPIISLARAQTHTRAHVHTCTIPAMLQRQSTSRLHLHPLAQLALASLTWWNYSLFTPPPPKNRKWEWKRRHKHSSTLISCIWSPSAEINSQDHAALRRSNSSKQSRSLLCFFLSDISRNLPPASELVWRPPHHHLLVSIKFHSSQSEGLGVSDECCCSPFLSYLPLRSRRVSALLLLSHFLGLLISLLQLLLHLLLLQTKVLTWARWSERSWTVACISLG